MGRALCAAAETMEEGLSKWWQADEMAVALTARRAAHGPMLLFSNNQWILENSFLGSFNGRVILSRVPLWKGSKNTHLPQECRLQHYDGKTMPKIKYYVGVNCRIWKQGIKWLLSSTVYCENISVVGTAVNQASQLNYRPGMCTFSRSLLVVFAHLLLGSTNIGGVGLGRGQWE